MSDELFNREEFISYFRDEAEELLQQIDADLLKLEEFVQTGEHDPEIVNSLFRALHTVKGSAGMLGFTDVQGLAHKLENLCDLLRKDRMPLSESVLEILFSGRDLLTELVEAAIGDQPSPTGVAEYIEKLDKFTSIYEQTAQVIEGRGGPEQSFEAAHAAEQTEASPNDAEAFEAEARRQRLSSRLRPNPSHPKPRRRPQAPPPRPTPSRSVRPFTKRSASTSSVWMRYSISSANW
jgi:chemotaxis protein histidine kinase CheA